MLFFNPNDNEMEENVQKTFDDYYRNGYIHYVENYAIKGLHFTEYILVKNHPIKFLLCEGLVVALQHYQFANKG